MQIKTTIRNLKSYKTYLKVEEAVHEFMKKKGYLKVDLPVLSPALIPESYLEVFQTDFIYLEKREKLFLTPSPELFLKRLLVHGVGNCYFLGKAFRNSEPNSERHTPEFKMLEYYKTKSDYMDIADELLHLLRFISLRVNPSTPFRASGLRGLGKKFKNEITYENKKILLDKWEKLTVAQAFQKYAGIKDIELFNHKSFIEKAKQKGYRVDGFIYEDIWSQMYTQEIEPHLGMDGYPTVIYDYPKEFGALAKLNKDGKTAQRFEFYIAGVELGDCYTELTDWKEQEERFNEEYRKRKMAKKINHPIDKGFIEALQYGLADCAGIAIGFDRLAMIYANATSIDDLKLISIR